MSDLMGKEDLVQAIVIADNFNKAFAPLTDNLPIALLPIVNRPLIDYTLECLALGGVQEVFLFCSSHVEQIRGYILKGIENVVNWSVRMQVHIIASECCQSFGDGLRDLDAKGLLRGDFILLSANTIANINFLPIIASHKKNCKKDKGCSMTLIYKEAMPGQRGRCPQDELVLGADRTTKQVLYHQKLAKQSLHKKLEISLETLLDCSKVDLRFNLQDTHIAVCSSSVLPLFSDNFDFQTRDDLVRGLLNDEILTNTIYWHLTTDYAACVNNWSMYQAVSYDIIHRWVFPLVPDMMNTSEQDSYMYLRNSIYRTKSVKIAKGAQVIENVVIGPKTSINENTILNRSVIGANCKIGKNCKIENSFILDDTVISDNVDISYSVIGSKCIIKPGVKLSESCIIGENVQLEQSFQSALIQSSKPENGTKDDKLGNKAYRVRSYSERREDSDSEGGDVIKLVSKLCVDSDFCDSEDEDDDESFDETGSEMSHMNSPVQDDTNMFLTEVVDSLARGYEDKLACDNLILEINSSRYAYNVTLKEVNYNVMKAILSLPFQQKGDKPFLQTLNSLLTYFAPILSNYIKNKSSMIDCLQAIQDSANTTCSELIKCVVKVVHWFYDRDYLSESVILEWFGELDKSSRLYTQITPFIKWLEEADEESGSEEESE